MCLLLGVNLIVVCIVAKAAESYDECFKSVKEITAFSKGRGFLSPKAASVLAKIERSEPLGTQSDLNVWAHLVKQLKKNNFELPDLPNPD